MLLDPGGPSVRGQPHRVRAQPRPARGRDKHLVLDTLHVHSAGQSEQGGGPGGALPGGGQHQTGAREEGAPVLPVGGVLSAVPGQCGQTSVDR